MSVLASDPFDVRLATRATGLLRTFNRAGVLTAADVHVAVRLGKLGNETSEAVHLAIALGVRAVRLGSVCIDLSTVRESTALDAASGPEARSLHSSHLPWPDPEACANAVTRSPLTAIGPEGDPPPLENGRP